MPTPLTQPQLQRVLTLLRLAADLRREAKLAADDLADLVRAHQRLLWDLSDLERNLKEAKLPAAAREPTQRRVDALKLRVTGAEGELAAARGKRALAKSRSVSASAVASRIVEYLGIAGVELERQVGGLAQ